MAGTGAEKSTLTFTFCIQDRQWAQYFRLHHSHQLKAKRTTFLQAHADSPSNNQRLDKKRKGKLKCFSSGETSYRRDANLCEMSPVDDKWLGGQGSPMMGGRWSLQKKTQTWPSELGNRGDSQGPDNWRRYISRVWCLLGGHIKGCKHTHPQISWRKPTRSGQVLHYRGATCL